MIRVLLVEDYPLVSFGLRTLIGAQQDMQVIGEASSAKQALAQLTEKSPDVVILPLRLERHLVGVELCREIKSSPRAPRVVIYTSYNSMEDASSSFLSGADGFVHKGEETPRLLEAIRGAVNGRRVWLLGMEPTSQIAKLEMAIETTNLTKREREVLGLMLRRFTNAQIANELFVELPTVKTHASSILHKLGLHSRQDLF